MNQWIGFMDFSSTSCSTSCYKLLEDIIACNFKEKYWSKLKKMTKNLILSLI